MPFGYVHMHNDACVSIRNHGKFATATNRFVRIFDTLVRTFGWIFWGHFVISNYLEIKPFIWTQLPPCVLVFFCN